VRRDRQLDPTAPNGTVTRAVLSGKIVTSVPMHPGDMSRSLLKKILKQVGWSEEQFRKRL
jgi:hypothetical protein